MNLLEACRRYGVEKLVFASTGGAIYGEVPEGRGPRKPGPRPKSPYAASKAAFELYLSAYGQNYGLKWASLRYGNVYGPRQDPHGEAGVVAIFAERVLKGEPVTLYARRTPGTRDACGTTSTWKTWPEPTPWPSSPWRESTTWAPGRGTPRGRSSRPWRRPPGRSRR